jgi:phage gpG-like protein
MPPVSRYVTLPNGLTVRIDIDLDEFAGIVEGMASRADDAAPMLDEIAELQRRSYAKTFAEGGRPAWAPLRPSTIARKTGTGTPKRTAKGNVPSRLVQLGNFGAANILIARGVLRDSYVQQGAKGHVEEKTDTEVFVGSQLVEQAPQSTPRLRTLVRKGKLTARAGRAASSGGIVRLAAIHESGNPKGNLPARKVAVVQEEDLKAVQDATSRYIAGGQS